MKKVLFAFIALALVVSVGACKKADVAQPAAAEKPATVATEPAKPDFKIGLVFDVGGKGDRSFNDSAYAGLVHIGALPHLGVLGLGGTAVTDAGLVHLKATRLRSLTLSGTRVTPGGIEDLKKSVRRLDVVGP